MRWNANYANWMSEYAMLLEHLGISLTKPQQKDYSLHDIFMETYRHDISALNSKLIFKYPCIFLFFFQDTFMFSFIHRYHSWLIFWLLISLLCTPEVCMQKKKKNLFAFRLVKQIQIFPLAGQYVKIGSTYSSSLLFIFLLYLTVFPWG